MKHSNHHADSLHKQKAAEAVCGRREERDSEYRKRILTSAQSLFEKHGIEEVTMYQIAKEAGVGQGTLYRRYPHIGEVCSDLLRSGTAEFLDSLDSSLADADPQKAALSQLSQIIIRIIDFIDDKAPLLAGIKSMYTDKKRTSIHQKPIYVRLHSVLETLINSAVSQGEIQPIDVTLTVNTILSSLSPEQYLYHREVLGYSKQRFTEGICRLFVKGL
ncbi:TetR/AcrR family transcriptional regulator [Paenibacillus eucommiae]|uniref:AcrR family transcriptional regulator n=1 Tax=Paenibacillus eucommiae TaxID=1355755 RepID=A0ABS4IQX5_9BACL|nr:TetR/AcrR family transcriptional regulator [Paenibacillus eucommiae]MBP1989976.1 AcrR family transcriptional regulator [Paenibacillus eucommiae]